MKKEFTRSEYIKGLCTLSEYMRQFITETNINITVSRIGAEKILKSTDKHFNDIPLKKWDSLSDLMRMNIDQKAWRRLAYDTYKEPPVKGIMYWSICDGVCIAKEAARIFKEREIDKILE